MPDYTACEGVTEATTLRVDALETENAILRQREAEVRTLMKRVVNLGFGATDDDVRVVEELKDRAEAWLKATEDGEKP